MFQKVLECPRMTENGPEGSWKVPEASGRFQKFPDSTTYCTHPLAWGASHLGCPKSVKEVGHHRGSNPTPSRIAILLGVGGLLLGELESKMDSSPRVASQGPLATYIR